MMFITGGKPFGKGPGSQMMLRPANGKKQQDWVMWKEAVCNKNNVNDVLEVGRRLSCCGGETKMMYKCVSLLLQTSFNDEVK